MYRKIVAITLGVSFVAMATSGLMMFFINQTSFTLQMHPVHKLFGLLLVVAAVLHIILNIKPLLNHLKARSVAITGGVLTVVLILLYGLAINNPIPPETAEKLDALSHEAEMLRE